MACASAVNAVNYYPFSDECTCDDFCDYKCAPEEQPPQNITVYRMSMRDVYDLTNKDTGNVAGDASFVISRRTLNFQCD
jgi:hypothetical protein